LEVSFEAPPTPVPYIIELATYPERRAEEEAARDAILFFLDRGIVPEVVTIVLAPRGKLRISGEWEMVSPRSGTKITVKSRVIEMWTLPAEQLLAAGDVGLVPLVVLAQSTEPPAELLARCRERIDQQASGEEHRNLLAVTQVLARLRYNDPALLALFGGVQTMIESPAFDDLREYIQRQERREAILDNLRSRFGSVPEDLAEQVRRIEDLGRLQELRGYAAVCPDINAFRVRVGA
jgi:hypothetical protein